MALLFISSYTKEYYSKPFSLSAWLWLIFVLFGILLPLFAGYATEDFWPIVSTYYDQPIVEYSGTYLLFHISEGGENQQNYRDYFYSSHYQINDLYPANLATDVVTQVAHYEDNKTKKTNKIVINIQFNCQGELYNTKGFFFFNYGINSKTKLLMKTLAFIDLDGGCYDTKLKGDLILKQRSPLVSGAMPNKVYYHEDVFYSDKFTPFDFLEVYNEYTNRNLTTQYKYEAFVSGVKKEYRKIEIEINIPKFQKIMYLKRSYELMKGAWIQYLFVFLPIAFLLRYILLEVLENRIFSCYVKNDLPNNM